MVPNLWAKLNTLNSFGILDALQWLGGRLVYVSPQGSDSNYGNIDSPLLTLTAAYALLRTGYNDAIVIMQDWQNGLSDSASSCTIRVDAAFSWNKSATHLVGLNPSFAEIPFSPRARLAPTSTTTAFANFFTVPAGVTGCLFHGVQFYNGFGTDTTSQICVTVTGPRNMFYNCHISGNTNATDAGARSLLLTSGAGNKGENYFENCTIGLDTVSRSAASAIIGFSGSQVPRNYFKDCRVVSAASSATALMITAASQSIDRFAYFEDCKFINYGTALTHLGSFNASQNGTFMFENPALFGMPDFGSTAVVQVLGYAPSAGAGIAIAPTA